MSWHNNGEGKGVRKKKKEGGRSGRNIGPAKNEKSKIWDPF